MSTAESTTEIKAEHVTKDKLVEDLKAVAEDLEELLKATANQTGERVAAVRTKAGESLKAAKARLAEAQSSMLEHAKAGVKATDDYVHANPWMAVGVAAALGAIIGTLISRR